MRAMTPTRRVVVFGGTGFLGQRVVRHLLDRGFAVRIATHHPDRSRGMVAGKDSGLESIPMGWFWLSVTSATDEGADCSCGRVRAGNCVSDFGAWAFTAG